jgi:hypothetical protein
VGISLAEVVKKSFQHGKKINKFGDIMKFKNVWVEKEIPQITDDLLTLLKASDLFCRKKWNKEVLITEIMRTREQQENIYKDTPKYKGKPLSEIPNSVHMYGRGADIRTHHLEMNQINELVNFLNLFPYGKGNLLTALYHDIGTGAHIHIQVRG